MARSTQKSMYDVFKLNDKVIWRVPPPTRALDTDKKLRERYGPGPFWIEKPGSAVVVRNEQKALSQPLGAAWFVLA